ncbi:hypothetical protein [Sinomonas sp. B1-1]|uniref:hypothetical protein n=1 Tax=Sinomonas sp. B1-1 TaxID=3141454 RepID=UPI003D295468
MGELNAASPDGFTHTTTSTPTRPIIVSDGSGKTLYSARTADTPKAADNHVRHAGFRRTGDWVNGAAKVEPIPAAEKRRRRLITAAVVVGLLVASAAGCNALRVSSEVAEAARASASASAAAAAAAASVPFTAKGTILVRSTSIQRDIHNIYDKSNDNCQPIGGYKDLGIDTAVKIVGPKGQVSTGRIRNGKQSSAPGSCTLTWEVSGVIPVDYGTYSLFFGHRDAVEVSLDELKRGYEGGIGDGT